MLNKWMKAKIKVQARKLAGEHPGIGEDRFREFLTEMLEVIGMSLDQALAEAQLFADSCGRPVAAPDKW